MRIVLDATGYDGGPRVALCEAETLGAYRPGWTAEPGSLTVESFMYDERKPNMFWVYPPAAVGAVVEVVVALHPARCVSVDDPLSVPDGYANALLYYVMMRGAEKAQDFNRAALYRKQYMEALQLKDAGEARGSPNLRNQGGAEFGGGMRA